MLYYNTIKPLDVANGKGISCSIFFQGCSHHCKNCFNQETWSFKGGKEFNEKEQEEFIKNANKSVVSSISILGGDPLQQDSKDLYNFLEKLKKEVNKPIFLWTGYIYEEIPEQKSVSRMGWVGQHGFSPYVDDLAFDGENNFKHIFTFHSYHIRNS